MKILLSIVVLAWFSLGARAQGNPSASPVPPSPELQGTAQLPVEAPQGGDKETPLQTIKRKFEEIRQERENNDRRFADIKTRLQELQRSPSADAFVEAAVALRHDMEALRMRLDIERENQIEFKNRVDGYSSNGQALKQETSYLSQYMENLRFYGMEQERTIKILATMERNVLIALDSLPPPLEFANRLGISFVLIQAKGQVPFYISARPLTVDEYLGIRRLLAPPDAQADEFEDKARAAFGAGLNHVEAQELAMGMARLSGDWVSLPVVSQIPALNEVGYGEKLEQAVWLFDKWSAPHEEREAMARFGITLAAVWDPAQRLARRESPDRQCIFGELPEAHYGALGCVFVIPAAAGKNARIVAAEERLARISGAGDKAQ